PSKAQEGHHKWGGYPTCDSLSVRELDQMKTRKMLVELGPMHPVLAAAGRSPEIPEKMDIYGWLIGSWELELVGYDDEGNVILTTGEAHFAWVLEGRAVQDVFINPRRSDRGPHSPKFANWYGTTLRIYDASIG